MENPLVSVFMPVFNCEKYIKESLESILNQTYSNLEILIIDDGSTDNTIEIISSYNDKRIRLLKNGENKGIPFTRNRGLEESKGKYMAIMDADDIAFLNRIERQVNYMEVNKDIDVVASYFNIFGGRIKKSYKPKLFSPEEISAKLIFSNPIGNSTAFIRLETIKINKLKYNANYFVAQDYDMWVQISKVGKISILPEILLEYRISSNNITKKSTKNSLLQRKRVIDSINKY
ncbi:glycosyltransferase family 2 protein [Pseudoneobacillus rhizosphaerae]|uniref:Glycosyltransferase EpsE n=1 Tax=Pseudoneobacillus rhizosphaerae TaxID=2880968 RepID=A0A9C7G6S1_9BACI|nr:glycosyltransferase [Pseudoneobacillus rhizosphaerae]CAG9606590.1 Putative glycosyltransferase EpsE [Pseudoneobacillus rhizosphaerae]